MFQGGDYRYFLATVRAKLNIRSHYGITIRASFYDHHPASSIKPQRDTQDNERQQEDDGDHSARGDGGRNCCYE